MYNFIILIKNNLMSRAKWKGPYLDKTLVSKIIQQKALKIKQKSNKIVLFNRSSTIVPALYDYELNVYNGKIFHKIKITEEMFGYKLGEFSPTKKQFSYKKKKKF
jgi:small subunit ribosomal protein S19